MSYAERAACNGEPCHHCGTYEIHMANERRRKQCEAAYSKNAKIERALTFAGY